MHHKHTHHVNNSAHTTTQTSYAHAHIDTINRVHTHTPSNTTACVRCALARAHACPLQIANSLLNSNNLEMSTHTFSTEKYTRDHLAKQTRFNRVLGKQIQPGVLTAAIQTTEPVFEVLPWCVVCVWFMSLPLCPTCLRCIEVRLLQQGVFSTPLQISSAHNL